MAIVARALVLGVATLVAALFSVALVEESGYNCTLGHIPEQAGSVYRVLPWGRTERLFFIAHVGLYPVAALIGGAAGQAWYGSKQALGCVGMLLVVPVLAVLVFVIQTGITGVFMNLDACGPGYYRSSGLVRLIGVEVAFAGLLASAIGVYSWLSTSQA